MYALTFPSGIIAETLLKATLFAGGILGFMNSLDFLKKIMSHSDEFLLIKIRFIKRLHEFRRRVLCKTWQEKEGHAKNNNGEMVHD
jgi:hypothetical protein